jgi:3-deoxy-D-manno-octulosonate 8-phosphate phosphatase (KDO 8-P phosphatase)
MLKKIRQKAKKISMLILDVDGVLTDGKIIYDSKGNEMKFFNVLDGLGLVLLRKAGIKTAIITAKASKVVVRRSKDMQILRVYQNRHNKQETYREILKEFKLSDDKVCFMGDELIDLPVLKRVGLAVAVSNAVSEVKKVADYVTARRGGEGAVREVVELILKSQKKWDMIVESYQK